MSNICHFWVKKEPKHLYVCRISNILSQAYSHTECSYRSKKEMWRDLDKFCAVYVDKFKQWYRAEVLDWLLVTSTSTVPTVH